MIWTIRGTTSLTRWTRRYRWRYSWSSLLARVGGGWVVGAGFYEINAKPALTKVEVKV